MYAKTEFKNSLYKVMLYSLVIIVLDVAAIVLLQSYFKVDLGADDTCQASHLSNSYSTTVNKK